MEQNKREQFIIRRIGGTTYKVRVVFNESGGETMEDKILRIRTDASRLTTKGGFTLCGNGRLVSVLFGGRSVDITKSIKVKCWTNEWSYIAKPRDL